MHAASFHVTRFDVVLDLWTGAAAICITACDNAAVRVLWDAITLALIDAHPFQGAWCNLLHVAFLCMSLYNSLTVPLQS